MTAYDILSMTADNSLPVTADDSFPMTGDDSLHVTADDSLPITAARNSVLKWTDAQTDRRKVKVLSCVFAAKNNKTVSYSNVPCPSLTHNP